MTKWYEVNKKNPEYSRCRRCLQAYNTKDVIDTKACLTSRCGYDGNVDADSKESLERIHGRE